MLNNKLCLLVAHGKSIEELEFKIDQFKDFDVTWCSMSSFDIPEEGILSKINKRFTVVYDSSTVQNAADYELKVRVPRLSRFLDRQEDNRYICTKTDKANLFWLRHQLGLNFSEKYKDKIIYVEDLGIEPSLFCVSLHLYIACLYKMGAKQVILLGADGGGVWGNDIKSYYKYELVKQDKLICGNFEYNMVGDTNNVNGSWAPLMEKCLGYVPNVLNCSPYSSYTCFEKINYAKLLQILREQTV